MLRPTRALRLVQMIALAMTLVMAGLVNGLHTHVPLEHPTAALVHAPLPTALKDHEHSHDDPIGNKAVPSHETAHHHVVDALATWPPGISGPEDVDTGCVSPEIS